jgi:hypothetical protein
MIDSKITIRPYKAEDLKILVPDIAPGWSEVNQTSGPAITVVLDGEILLCGGLRIYGLGEAWLACSQNAREHHKKSIFEISKEYIEKFATEKNIWRLVTSAKEGMPQSPEFIKRLGFIETNPGFFVHERYIIKDKQNG